jgi:hypothetical protein
MSKFLVVSCHYNLFYGRFGVPFANGQQTSEDMELNVFASIMSEVEKRMKEKIK